MNKPVQPVQPVSSTAVSSTAISSGYTPESASIAPDEAAQVEIEQIGVEQSISQDISQTVSRYFETLSAEDFRATAALFSEDGTLYPPFETPVTGREAIVAYLEAEAQGMQISPLQHEIEPLEDGNVQCKVKGKVQMPLFGVNVGWTFVLNPASEIMSVRIKLLAALEELLKLKPEAAES